MENATHHQSGSNATMSTGCFGAHCMEHSMSCNDRQADFSFAACRRPSPTDSLMTVPAVAQEAPGIVVQGHLVRSLVFSTDVAAISLCNADAVLAVYPFTCQPVITQALVNVARRPVFTGVGGSVTHGERCVDVALYSEMQGVAGVVLNVGVPTETVAAVVRRVHTLVMATVCAADDRLSELVCAGASVVNVAAGVRTAEVVSRVRALYPALSIVATGGQTQESIERTIAAGADAVSWTPPSIQSLEHELMDRERARCGL